MVQGQLRVAVIGTQTENADSKNPFTVYRTTVNYRGQCYQRLLRYRQFLAFKKKLRVRDPVPVKSEFPKKEWTRQTSLQDDVVEARQVLLNEYMREVVDKELTVESEEHLLRLLKVGKYDADERRRDTAPQKMPLGSRQGERPTVDVHQEMDHESAEKAEQHLELGQATAQRMNRNGATDTIGGSAMIVNTPVVFPQVTSIAETVLTEDEESTVEERASVQDHDDDDNDDDDDDDDDDARGRSSSAASVTPYSKMHLDHPPVRSSVSVPVHRAKKVKFHADGKIDTTNPAKESSPTLSPERKYRDQIEKKISSIEDILSDYDSKDGLVVPPEYRSSSSSVTTQDRAGSA